MNLKMVRPKNQTEDVLLSLTKNCETLIKQTHRKSEQTLEFRIMKSKESFRFNPPIQIKGKWMLRSTNLEVSISIFNIIEEFIKLKLYKFPDSRSGGV